MLAEPRSSVSSVGVEASSFETKVREGEFLVTRLGEIEEGALGPILAAKLKGAIALEEANRGEPGDAHGAGERGTARVVVRGVDLHHHERAVSLELVRHLVVRRGELAALPAPRGEELHEVRGRVVGRRLRQHRRLERRGRHQPSLRGSERERRRQRERRQQQRGRRREPRTRATVTLTVVSSPHRARRAER